MSQARDNYAFALDNLRVLAQRDLLAWWKQTEGLGFIEQRRLLERPFGAIVQAYGEQAAFAAADYLFLERSFDETLRELEYPEVAAPAEFDQIRKAYRSATWLKDVNDPVERQLALTKLQGITNRLVTQPARQTVELGVARAGTKYARIPEPGACAWCLMLGSRGAEYSKDTVFGELERYHDNCRCLGIEVKNDADLPRINQELMELSKALNHEFGGKAEVQDWRQYITARRQQSGRNVEWPRLQYCRVPKYKGDGMSRVFPGERLPPLDKMPGHVLHGWRDLNEGDKKRLARGEQVQGWPHDESLADGHRWDSQRSGASVFSKEWTDQQIADAVRDTLENPQAYKTGSTKRVVWRKYDDQYLRVEYDVVHDGSVKFGAAFLESYLPRRGVRHAKGL